MRDYDFPIIVLGILWILYRLIFNLIKKDFSLKNDLVKGIFAFSLIGIYSVTLFPFPFYIEPMFSGLPYKIAYNLIPFHTIYDTLHHFYYMVPLRNIGGNILLFVPVGFVIALRFPLLKGSKVICRGFLLSFIVELCQLFIPMRSFDVDDLILNTLGVSIGYLRYKLLMKTITKKKTSLKTEKEKSLKNF